MTVRQETEEMLISFLEGRIRPVDLEAWIASIEEDESFSVDERDDLTKLRLLVQEAGEKIRPRSEAIEFAMDILLGGSSAVVVRTAATDSNPTIWEEQPQPARAGAA